MAVKRLRPIENNAQKKSERNRRLSESDWTQMNDSPLTSTEQGKWKKYRQSLRDMKFSDDAVVWPLTPAQEKAKPATGKRAHKADGSFKADDKSTPDVNEAYEDGKTPAKKTRKSPAKKAATKKTPTKKATKKS